MAEKNQLINQNIKRIKKNIYETEYSSFTEVLHKNNIPYCMDSGVLLALMRDGKVFDHEKDVDLQMWSGHKDRVIELIPEFKSKGWKVTIWLYKGLIYQFRVERSDKIPVHIMLFRKYKDWAWCPAGKAIGNPASFKIGKKFYSGFVNIRRKLRNRFIMTDVSRWPWKVRRVLATWWIPAEFYEHTVYNEKFKIYVPQQWDKYLKYRYGDWRVPAEKWDFWVDDGAINNKRPEELVDFSMFPKCSPKDIKKLIY